MKRTSHEIDKLYLDSFRSMSEKLITTYNSYIEDYEFNLNGSDITVSIIQRLKHYYELQESIKIYFKKYMQHMHQIFLLKQFYFT